MSYLYGKNRFGQSIKLITNFSYLFTNFHSILHAETKLRNEFFQKTSARNFGLGIQINLYMHTCMSYHMTSVSRQNKRQSQKCVDLSAKMVDGYSDFTFLFLNIYFV